MENRSFPRWTAPMVGAGTGVFLGFQVTRQEGNPETVKCLVCGAVIGLVAGGIICLLDRPKTRPKSQQERTDNLSGTACESGIRESSLISRFLALLSIVIFCVPLVGLVVSLIAVLMNIRVEDWPRIMSWVAVSLSTVVSVLFVVAWMIGM